MVTQINDYLTIITILSCMQLKLAKMQETDQEVEEMIMDLQYHTPKSYEPAFQADICKMFKFYTPTRKLFKLVSLTIQNYGFGVLPTLKPLYQFLSPKQKYDFSNELLLIQVQAFWLLGDFSLTHFEDLEFLKVSSKKERKAFKRQAEFAQNKAMIPSLTKQRSVQFAKIIFKIKNLTLKLSKLTIKDIPELLKQYNFTDFHKLDNFNFFEVSYHSLHIANLKKELTELQIKCKNDQKIFSLISQCLWILPRDEATENFYNNKIYSNEQSEIYNSQDEEDASPEQLKVRQSPLASTPLLLKLPQQEHNAKLNDASPFAKPPTNVSVSSYLCCRRFFYLNQIIEEAESIRRQYKFYCDPFRVDNADKLCKTMVSFLNSFGGIIYLGIKEELNRLRKVVGLTISQNSKEEFLKQIRFLAQKIHPDIVFPTQYSVKFVPLKTSQNAFISGKYVIKIIIPMGKPKELYYYMNSLEEGAKVAFRTENEVLVKDAKTEFGKIVEIVKNRLLDAPREPIIDHEWKCPEPETGLPDYF